MNTEKQMDDGQKTLARIAAEEIDGLLAHRLAPSVYLKDTPSIQEMAAIIQKQQGWRPIDTAPKDEPLWLAGQSLVDEDYNRKGVVEGYWLDDLGWMGAVWNNEQDYWESKQINPTHWMPIPDPPAATRLVGQLGYGDGESMITQEIVMFCAEEVERQGRGPLQVAWMIEAWDFAMGTWEHCWPVKTSTILLDREGMLQKLGSLVERRNPDDRWRQYGVRVGERVCPSVSEVPQLMARWMEKVKDMTPEEAYKELMLIHPFVDGNGRVGKIVYNGLKGSLDKPQMPPNFFNCANP